MTRELLYLLKRWERVSLKKGTFLDHRHQIARAEKDASATISPGYPSLSWQSSGLYE